MTQHDCLGNGTSRHWVSLISKQAWNLSLWFWTLHIPIGSWPSLNDAPWFMPLSMTVIVCLFYWCREDVQIKHSMHRLLAEVAKQSFVTSSIGCDHTSWSGELNSLNLPFPFPLRSKITYQKKNYFFFVNYH